MKLKGYRTIIFATGTMVLAQMQSSLTLIPDAYVPMATTFIAVGFLWLRFLTTGRVPAPSPAPPAPPAPEPTEPPA